MRIEFGDASSKLDRMKDKQNRQGYWRDNIRIVSVLLCIWFLVAFCASILFIVPLNRIQVGNIGLGFWFAQQGSIFVFIALVLIYALWMDRLDRKYDVGD